MDVRIKHLAIKSLQGHKTLEKFTIKRQGGNTDRRRGDYFRVQICRSGIFAQANLYTFTPPEVELMRKQHTDESMLNKSIR